MASSSDVAWERISALKPIVLEHRAEADEVRRLPDAVVKAFYDADVYRMLLPADLGGLELDPLTGFDLVEDVASCDPSAGWNLAIAFQTPSICGGFSTDWLRAHFATSDCGTATSGGAAAGRAIPVPGGYRLSGKWTFASGVHQARRIGGYAVVMEGDSPRLKPSGAPDVRLFMLRPEQITILDSWRTTGMRGTGSADWQASEVFVPEQDTAYAITGTSDHPAPIFRVPTAFFAVCFTASALGAARMAIEGLKALAAASPETFRARGYVQYAIAKASALHGSSRRHVRESFRPIWDNVVAGAPHTMEQKAEARAAFCHGVESAVAAAELCFEAAGAGGIYQTWPIERALRDARTIQGHAVLSRRMMEVVGQALLGMTVTDPVF